MSVRRLRVMHLLGQLRPSGMERMLVSAKPYFDADGIDGVIVGQEDSHPFAAELRAAGYSVHIIPAVNSWTTARRLRKQVEALDVDVVHIHTESQYLRTVFSIFWAQRGAKSVRTVHSVFDAHGAWRLKRTLQAVLGDIFVGSIVSPTRDVQEIERKFFRRTSVISNWVDDRFFSIRGERAELMANHSGLHEPPIALIVGNCSSIKRHFLALEAIEVAGHRLIHLGDETHAPAQEVALLDRLEYDGRVITRGVHAPDEALKYASYFVLPSQREGMGVALAEAVVAGVPAIVSVAPGLGWTRFIEGVHHVRDDDWARAVSEATRRCPPLMMSEYGDGLRAVRGAKSYAQLYRRIAAKRHAIFDNTKAE